MYLIHKLEVIKDQLLTKIRFLSQNVAYLGIMALYAMCVWVEFCDSGLW